jgi:hypothetical protein
MAKQTLKSLLGASDEREQVELNLDDATFRAPRVQAGQYSVRVQQTLSAGESTAGQLANSLGRYAGPIARQYQSIETQRQEEFADIAGLFTNEEAAAIVAGDTTKVRESLDTTINALDSRQRKKALKFVENPANYIRASRVLGQKIANQYNLDLIQNKDQYVNSEEDMGTLLKNTRDDVIKNNNLSGYSLEGFLDYANRYDQKHLPVLQTARDEVTETNYITNSVDSIVGQAEGVEDVNFTEVASSFSELFQAYTPAEQSQYLETTIDRLLAKGDYDTASKFVGWMATDENGLLVGNAALPEGTFNLLNEKIEKHQIDRENFEQKQQQSFLAENNEAIQLAVADLNEGKAVENITLSFGPETQVEVNLKGVKEPVELLERARSAIYSAELEPETNKGGMYASLTKQIESLETDNINRYNRLGVTQLMQEFQSSLTLEVAGENVLGLTNDQALEMRFKAEQRLRDGLDEIQRDNEKYPTMEDKVTAQLRLVEQTRLELSQSSIEMFKTYNDTTRVLKVQDRVGLGVNGSFVPQFSATLRKALTDPLTNMPPTAAELKEINALAKTERDRLLEATREIMTAPYSEEERKDPRLAFENRQRQIDDLIDESISDAIDARTEEQQMASTTPRKQQEQAKAQPRDLTKPNGRLRYVPNYDGAVSDRPNGYQQDGILFHPDGQNYRGKFPSGVLYNEGVMRDSKYKRRAENLDKLRTKVIEQVEGERRIVLADPREKRVGISYTAEKYMEALYGQRTAIDAGPAITVDEIRAGMLEGKIPFDPTKIRFNAFPVLSPEMINNPDQYEDVILDYASALNVPREQVPAFLYAQAQALSSRGIIFKTTINTQIEE